MAWRGRLALLLALNLPLPAEADGISPAERRSGFDFMSPETQAMQQDDIANPGMLWVLDGERLWDVPAGGGGSCGSCHADAESSMRGVAARYPAYDETSQAPIDLAGRIGQCRELRQQGAPLGRDSDELLSLTAYVAHQSRGIPVEPAEDSRLQPFRERGRQLFERPLGQLGLSCAECHDRHWGQRLGGAPIPQAHPTGYPIYRLEWQSVGSLQRRLRGCLVGVRAEPFASGAPELIELELYLMSRAQGLAIEAPGVRP